MAASLGIIVSVSAVGVSSRDFQETASGPFYAGTPPEAYGILKERGGKGRVALCVSLHGHSTAIDDGGLMRYEPHSIQPVDLLSSFREMVDGGNLFWVLMQEGVVRKVIYAVPDGEFRGISLKIKGREVSPPLDLSYRGSQILVHTISTLPDMDEPVLLFIDGSIYSALEASQVDGFTKGIRHDMVLVSPGFKK